MSFQTRLIQTKLVLPLSNEHGSQVKDQGRRQCCHNKHKKFPYRPTRDVSLLSGHASYNLSINRILTMEIHGVMTQAHNTSQQDFGTRKVYCVSNVPFHAESKYAINIFPSPTVCVQWPF